MSTDPAEIAAATFEAAYAQALLVTDVSPAEVGALAVSKAGESFAAAALLKAAELAADVQLAATTLASGKAESASADLLFALTQWAEAEAATERLAATLADAMTTPLMTVSDLLETQADAHEIAVTLGRSATLAAADTALQRAIVSRAVAAAAADLTASVANDGRNLIVLVAATAAKVHESTLSAAREAAERGQVGTADPPERH